MSSIASFGAEEGLNSPTIGSAVRMPQYSSSSSVFHWLGGVGILAPVLAEGFCPVGTEVCQLTSFSGSVPDPRRPVQNTANSSAPGRWRRIDPARRRCDHRQPPKASGSKARAVVLRKLLPSSLMYTSISAPSSIITWRQKPQGEAPSTVTTAIARRSRFP